MHHMREHRVTLCRLAWWILEEARAFRHGGSPIVFPSVRGGKQLGITAMSDLLRALNIAPYRTGSGLAFSTVRPRLRWHTRSATK